MAACSKNFAELFETAPAGANGSICVILEATSADNMQALLEFMYKGEVHVSQKALESFLKAAESLQVKGLTAEHGRFNTNPNQSHQPPNSPLHEPPVTRTRQQHQPQQQQQQRNSLSLNEVFAKNVKRETDMILHSTPSALASYASQYLPPYMPQLNYPEHPRKRPLKSPYSEQESPRGSVLREGSKGTPVSSQSPVGGKSYGGSAGRPASSASSVAPTEADTQQMERNSPQSTK